MNFNQSQFIQMNELYYVRAKKRANTILKMNEISNETEKKLTNEEKNNFFCESVR